MTDDSGPGIASGLGAWLAAQLASTGRSPAEAARDLGVNEATVRSWLSGRRPVEDGGEFAHLDTPAKLGDWLRARIAASGHSVRQIADSTEGVSMSTVYNWLGGEHLPRPPAGDEPDRFDLLLSNPRLGLNLRQRLRLDEIRRRLTGTSMRIGEPVPAWPARGLPADNRSFTGRSTELRRLDRLLREYGRGEDAVVAALTGTGGIGKTALAVHWARSRAVKATFTDGCCYLNLHGYADTPPLEPDAALTKLLIQLGTSAREIPDDHDAKSAFYQSSLAGRKLLVVLDNAHDEPQVRPLLPADPNCLTILTSRSRVPGLAATHPGISHLPLETLTDGEAATLLRNLLGRLATKSASEEEIEALVEVCGHLPLAVTVASANYLTHHHPRGTPIGEFAATLAEDRIGRLKVGTSDPDTSVAVALDRSYRHLSESAGRLYRLLGLYPGSEFSAAAAASLAGLESGPTEAALNELTQANQLTEQPGDRYALHDLLHDHAAALAEQFDAETGQTETARLRLVQHFTYTAHEAMPLVQPGRAVIELPPVDPAVSIAKFETLPDALTWFGAEVAALVATVERCHQSRRLEECWRLAWSLVSFFDRLGRWRVWAQVQELALESAVLLGRPEWQAQSHRLLGRALSYLERYEEARVEFDAAIAIADTLDDLRLRTSTLRSLGFLEYRQGNLQRAVEVNLHALSGYQELGDMRGEADALNNVAWCLAQLGHYDRASRQCLQSLRLYLKLGDREHAATAWDTLGYINSGRGDYATATYCFRRALTHYENSVGHRYETANAHRHMADNHRAAGQLDLARDQYLRALAIYESLEHRDSDIVRTALSQLGSD